MGIEPAAPTQGADPNATGPIQDRRNFWLSFWRGLTLVDTSKLIPRIALRNAIGVGLPLAAGVAVGHINSGVVASIGALNVAYSDGDEPYLQRARRMLTAAVLVAIGVFAGGLSGRHYPIAVGTTMAWAFGAGMLVALGQGAADLGTITLVTLVVFAAQGMGFEQAAGSALLALLGGLLQTALAVAFWPIRRYEPERRSLGELYREIARTTASRIVPTEAPPASAESTQAQMALASLAGARAVEAERYLMLLSQAERMRISLMTLMRLRLRTQRESRMQAEAGILERFLGTAARLLDAVGMAVREGVSVKFDTDCLGELSNLAERMRQASRDSPAPEICVLARDTRFQMDALAGQLRAALDLAAYATPVGLAAFERREARRQWSLRLMGTWATLRANVSLRSPACRHATRLAVCVGLGDALARGLGWQRPYWLPMTIAIVLKPDFTATFSRSLLRLVGTYAGLALSTALLHLVTPTPVYQVALIALFAFVMRWIGPANYGIFVTALTAWVVILIAMTGVPPQPVMLARALNTTLGGSIALAAYWLWPTWERAQVAETIAEMLDAYRSYFVAVRNAYQNQDSGPSRDLDGARLTARLARSTLEASLARLAAEPGVSPARLALATSMLASSHRLVHALMALEAGLSASHPVPPRMAFHVLADDVEKTLYFLSAALRGSPIRAADLPDLREDHHALIHSGDSQIERYALSNVETDRITNSMNTLSGEVMRWIGGEDQSA